MRSKILVALSAVAVIGLNSTAVSAGGGGGGGGGKGGAGGHFGHGHFGHRNFFHRDFDRRFQNNQLFNTWGSGWGLGGWGPYGEGNNTTIVTFPKAFPQKTDVTGSISATSCHFKEETFTVPSSAGGTKPITVVGCR